MTESLRLTSAISRHPPSTVVDSCFSGDFFSLFGQPSAAVASVHVYTFFCRSQTAFPGVGVA